MAKAAALEQQLDPGQRGSFYQLVRYPIDGSALMNAKMLNADSSFLHAYQGRADANLFAQRSSQAYQGMQQATEKYNATGHGKWQHFMSDQPRVLAVFEAPPTGHVRPQMDAGLGVAVEGSVDAWAPKAAIAAANYADKVRIWRTADEHADALPGFERATDRRHFLDVFDTGTAELSYKATPSAPWIKLGNSGGSTHGSARLWVSVDWTQVPEGKTVRASITVEGAGATHRVAVMAHNVSATTGTIVEDNGIVAMSADRYSRNVKIDGQGWQRALGLGQSGHALKVDALVKSYASPERAPYAQYSFQTWTGGAATVRASLLPTFPLNADHKLRYAVSVDGAPAQIVDVEAHKDWNASVQSNATMTQTTWKLSSAGTHILRVYAMDPGLVLDAIAVDLGGLQRSYLQPPETLAK